MNQSDDITRRALFARLGRLQGGGRAIRRDRRAPPPRPEEAPEARRDGRIARRLLLLGAGQIGLFGLLAVKLSRLQQIEGRKYTSLADDNRLARQFRPTVRGRIFDRNGTLLATNQDNLRVLLVPESAGDVAAALARLGAIVDIAERDRRRVLALAPKQSPRRPIVVRDGLAWGDFARINVLGPRLPGILTDIAWRRRYPFGADFAHLVGHLGQPDRLQLASEPALRQTDTRVGVAGLEQGFDRQLRGRPGEDEIEVDARGRHIRALNRTEPQPGRDLHLTVDQVLQQRVLQRLEAFRCAAAVVLDATNGEVLAMAATPTFDPNRLSDPLGRREWEALRGAVDDPMTDRASRGQYPPGSTFKMVTALAGLEAGVIDRRTRFACNGAIERGSHRFRCWQRSGHGTPDLYRALTQSCDVFFYETAERVGIRRLAQMAQRLGLGQVYHCGLPGQKAGLVPDPDWKWQERRGGWLGGETLLAGIGQGYVLATPLQLAVMTARLATGRVIQPVLVRSGAAEARLGPPRLPIAEASLQLVRRAMTGVVNDADGTAVKSALGLPGVLMAGKTGTAQVRGNGRRPLAHKAPWHERDHALFVAFAPAAAPRYALSVVVEHGESGGGVAGPAAADIMKMLLARDPHQRLSGFAGAPSPAVAGSGSGPAGGGAHD